MNQQGCHCPRKATHQKDRHRPSKIKRVSTDEGSHSGGRLTRGDVKSPASFSVLRNFPRNPCGPCRRHRSERSSPKKDQNDRHKKRASEKQESCRDQSEKDGWLQ